MVSSVKTSKKPKYIEGIGYVGNRFKNITNNTYGRLTVIRYVGCDNSGHSVWECLCECGNSHTTTSTALIETKSRSCGCYSKEVTSEVSTTHGKSNTKEYAALKNAVYRCTIPSNKNYRNYGARGIKVCDRWLNYKGEGIFNFLEDMGECPEGLTLDRIDVNGDYEPSNCRWVDVSIQGYNTRRHKTNTSGRTGVSEYIRNGRTKWQAYINVEGKRLPLGVFITKDAAITAREAAEIKYYGKLKEEKHYE